MLGSETLVGINFFHINTYFIYFKSSVQPHTAAGIEC